MPDSSQTRSCPESETFNVGDKTLRERTVRPVVDHDNLRHEQTMLNEVNMDFRIPGLPHSVVKHAQSASVRQLIQKIENHQDRHALQQDLRQNQAYNPFRPYSENLRISSFFYDMEVMQRNVWNENVSWQTGRLNNSTKYLLHALTTTTSKKKK